MARRLEATGDALEARIERITESGCWIWMGSTTKEGVQPMFWRGRGGQRTAYRAAYEHFVGPIPAALCVCHRGDIPLCVNPAHLFLGTQADNIADMLRKGRRAPTHGAAHPSASVTEQTVREMRAVYPTINDPNPYAAIARMFGVTRNQAYLVISRKRWRHI